MNHDDDDAVSVRPAVPAEADLLTALARRSKAYWGYAPAFMAACSGELTYTSEEIASDAFRFAICEVEGRRAGFYALQRTSADEIELEALFVEPAHIGKGCGRVLIEHAKATARGLGASRLVVQGDPHADRFYRAAGGVPVGRRASESIPGRELPLYEIELRRLRER